MQRWNGFYDAAAMVPFFHFFRFLFDRLYCRYFFCPGQELHV